MLSHSLSTGVAQIDTPVRARGEAFVSMIKKIGPHCYCRFLSKILVREKWKAFFVLCRSTFSPFDTVAACFGLKVAVLIYSAIQLSIVPKISLTNASLVNRHSSKPVSLGDDLFEYRRLVTRKVK